MVISFAPIVIANGEAVKQSRAPLTALDCFAALAMTKGSA